MIQSNTQLREVLGTSMLSASDDSNRILSFLPDAERMLTRAVGQEILDELRTEAAGNTLTTNNVKLYKLVVRVVALYAYWYYLPFSVGQEGDNGLQETETTTTKPVRLSVVNGRTVAVPELAGNAMEDVLQLLFSKPDDYPTWKASGAYKTTQQRAIKSGTELGEVFPPSGGSHRMYLTLLPWLRDAELDFLLPLMPTAFLQSLSERTAGDTLTENDKQLQTNIKRFLAWAAYLEALPHLVVQPTSSGLRVLSEFDGINNRSKPSLEQYELLRRTVEQKRDYAKGGLLAFLEASYEEFRKDTGGSVPNFMKKYERVWSL